jgi:antitoxin component of MazEF toxin-antitoxin module
VHLPATLHATGGNTTGFEIPAAVVDELGGGRRPKVVVTVNGTTFRTSIARMGERYLLGVSAERRAAAGLTAGDAVDIDIDLDTAPREVDVPDDLAAALAGNPAAAAFWDTLSFSARQWHTTQVTAAKTADTRARRVARSVTMLADGRAR